MRNGQAKIRTVALADLQADDQNANRGTKRGAKMLAESLRRLGAGRSVLIDKHGRIIAGNKTVEQARALGMKRIQVIETDGETLIAVQRRDLDLMRHAKARELATADNRIAEVDLDWNLDALKITNLDLSWLGLDTAPEAEEGPAPQMDRAAELQQKWGTALGQVWEIGKHRLMCGDCRLFDCGEVDIVFTDPPYNALKSWKKDEAHSETRLDPSRWFQNDNMEWSEYIQFIGSTLARLQGHSAYVCCDFRVYPIIVAELKRLQWEVKHCIVWKKNVFGLGKRYRFQHEFIAYACRGDAPFYGDRAQSDVWEIATADAASIGHNTPKPVALSARAISNSCARTGAVLDLFLGSGTTMVAAEQLGRVCYGMEIEPKYVAVCLQRMADMGLKPRLVK